MSKAILAVIMPVDTGARPDHELPGKPPGPSQGPGLPTHPIAPGGPPPEVWPGPGKPTHPIYWPLPPGAPVDPSYGVPIERPSHPIAPGGGGPRPDQGLPGEQPKPEHPIVLPPGGGGWLPVYIWGGGNEPFPTPPIVLPPDEDTDDGGKLIYRAVWTPDEGWQTIAIVIPGDDHGRPEVTPSAAKRK